MGYGNLADVSPQLFRMYSAIMGPRQWPTTDRVFAWPRLGLDAVQIGLEQPVEKSRRPASSGAHATEHQSEYLPPEVPRADAETQDDCLLGGPFERIGLGTFVGRPS